MKNKVRVLQPTATYQCVVCDHTWVPRKSGKPKRCASCKTPHWEEGDASMQVANALSALNMAYERLEAAMGLIESAREDITRATGVEVA